MVALRERFGVSERRACTVVGLHRSTMRLAPTSISDEEAELRAWLRTFSTDRPRWGWRRAATGARKAGWDVNNKRIRRLWRDEGLRVPQRRKKKRLTGVGVTVGAMCPIAPNVIWAMDFQFDTTADGRTIKMLNIIDEFSREALAIHVDRAINQRRKLRLRRKIPRLKIRFQCRSVCWHVTLPYEIAPGPPTALKPTHQAGEPIEDSSARRIVRSSSIAAVTSLVLAIPAGMSVSVSGHV